MKTLLIIVGTIGFLFFLYTWIFKGVELDDAGKQGCIASLGCGMNLLYVLILIAIACVVIKVVLSLFN